MSVMYDGSKGFTAGGAIGANLRVKLSSGKLALAGASDADIGVTETIAFADGDTQTVRLRTAPGTVLCKAAAAFASGAALFAAANGTVDDSGTVAFGTALNAASAAGDIVEVLRN